MLLKVTHILLMKGNLYNITLYSVKAFFDRTAINYNEFDIKNLFARLDNNKDGKICFKDLKNLFDLSAEVINSKNPLMKSLSGPIEPEVQYECIHLSRSQSPVRHISEANIKPVYSPNRRFQNNDYMSFVQHVRQTSLDKSKSRSLSRSSDYQSPGKVPERERQDDRQFQDRQEENELFYESRRCNRFNNSYTYETH